MVAVLIELHKGVSFGMLKKLICTMLVLSIFLVFGLTAFADPTATPTATPAATPKNSPALSEDVAKVLGEIGKDAETDKAGKLLVTITMPDQSTVSITKKSYIVSGLSDYSGVTVVLQVYDEEQGKYVAMKNTDGESSWDIGDIGAFKKEIVLNEGVNKIRILAFKASTKSVLKTEDVQVNKYSLILQKAGIKDVIVNAVVDFTADLNEFLFNNNKPSK